MRCGGYSSVWLERRTVDAKVGGSNPLTHPTSSSVLPVEKSTQAPHSAGLYIK